MYIDYNKLKDFFEKISREYKENNIDQIIKLINNWQYLNKLLDVTEIVKQKDIYQLKIADYYIGYMKTDLDYDTDRDKNKLRFILYIIKYYQELIPIFLRALLDINIKVLKENINDDITFKTKIIPKTNKKEYLSDDMYKVDSYIYHSIYFNDKFIGMDMIEDYGYKSTTDFTKEEDVFSKESEPLSINVKLMFLKTMKRYNDNYFDKYLNNQIKNKFHGK